MRERCTRPLICPICDKPLAAIGQSLQCPRRHSFDIAREGYVNLLLRPKRLAASVGDSTEMLQARRAFLERGLYAPLSAALNNLVAQQLPNSPNPVLVDAGCGEGYYTRKLADALSRLDACFFGVDVAKTAVRMAARQMKNGRFIVSDIHKKLPFATQSVDILLNIFAPRHPAEFARVLASTGTLLMIIPTPNHLSSLRKQFDLIGIQPDKRPAVEKQFRPFFTLKAAQNIHFDLLLDHTTLTTLIQMTPSARHLTAKHSTLIQETQQFQTTANFELLQFQRLSG